MEQQRVFLFVDSIERGIPSKAAEMCRMLSSAYSKGICLLSKAASEDEEANLTQYLSQEAKKHDATYMLVGANEDFTQAMEQAEASMIVFETANSRSGIMRHLKLCRNLRIPYFFCRETDEISFARILVPITFLIEEREKGPFASSFSRFLKSQISLMTAKDYGSRAKETTDRIGEVLTSAGATFDMRQATKDSFKAEREAAEIAKGEGYDLVICSASREYGLDDIIFGPKELGILRKTSVPVMLINPRGDLYTLCG